ncbi:MAG: hypothetical protein ACLUYK_01780 [Eggerthella lenta]
MFNLIVFASFITFSIIAQTDQNLAFLAIAIGNPLGIFVQMASSGLVSVCGRVSIGTTGAGRLRLGAPAGSSPCARLPRCPPGKLPFTCCQLAAASHPTTRLHDPVLVRCP